MPKEKNQYKSAAASDEKFRDFFTTTVADIPAEMVRREEEAAEEHKGLFGRLFGHAKPKQAPQAGTDLELPTGEVLLGADALAKHDGEEPLDLDLTLRTADPGTDFPQPKAEVPAAPEKPAVPDKPAPQPAPENKPEPPKAPAAPAPQPEKPRKKAAQKAEMERTSFTVTSQAIGEMVMDGLKEMDEVAYVRFASVYRQFKDIQTFMDELNKLLTDKDFR